MSTGTVSSANSTSLYSNTTDFTSGVVNSSVYSVNGGTGVTVNPTTGNVLVSIGQPVATTDNPTFAGATLGNITVGVSTNNTITTTSGDLILDSVTDLVDVNASLIVDTPGFQGGNIRSSGPNQFITVSQTTNSTNFPQNGIRLSVESTGTPAVGLGTNLQYQIETAPGVLTNGGVVQVESTDITPGAESFKMDFALTSAGTSLTRMELDHLGNLQIDGDLTVSGGTVTLAGSTSGTVALNAPAVAGTQSYTLPTAVPAVNGYVLSSTTGGVMSWAATAPGAGDVTGPASATDNALTRFDGTTGKLIQNSNAILDDTGNLSIAGDLTVTGTDITTGADSAIIIARDSSTTNSTLNPLIVRRTTSGTPAVGIGTGILFSTETASGTNSTGGGIFTRSTDITPGSESFNMVFNTRNAGVETERMVLDNLGNLQIDGDLTVTGAEISAGATNFTPIIITRNTATTAGIREALTLRIDSTGTPAVGIGTALEFETETAASTFTLGSQITSQSTDITPGAENFELGFGVRNNGSVTERMVLDNLGNLQIDGDLTVTGNNIISSSATALTLSGANVAVAGDLTVTGNNIISSSATALTLSGANVAVAGDLTVSGQEISTGSTSSIIISRETASTTAVLNPLTLRMTTTGTPAIGTGTSLIFETETAVGVNTTAGVIQLQSTDITPGSESFDLNFRVRSAGVELERMVLDNLGNLQIDGDLDVQGGDITDSTGTLTIGSSTGLINANPIYITPVNNTAISTGIGGTMSTNDYWHVGGYDITGTGTSDGALEIATANNGNEPIYIRQYTGGAASGPTWPFGNTILRTLTLLDASGNTALPGTLDVQGGTITDSTGALQITSGATNTNITLAPNGTGDVVLTLANGGNLTNSRNYVFGAIRNATTESNGDIWVLDADSGGAGTLPVRGVSIDNSSDTAKQAGAVVRNYSNTAAFGPRVVFERARGTSGTPLTLNSGDTIGVVSGTGYSSTLGWINDTLPFAPAVTTFTTAEAWSSNTNLGTTFNVLLAPTATTMTTAANLVSVIAANPQSTTHRSNAFSLIKGTGSGTNGPTLTINAGASNNEPLLLAGDVNIIQAASTWQTALTPGFKYTGLMSSSTQTASGSTFEMSSRWKAAATDTAFVPPVSGWGLGKFAFTADNSTTGTSQQNAGAIQSIATENWDSTHYGSKLLFVAHKLGTGGPVNVLDMAPETTSITSDIITLESSAGTDYAVFNATSATFAQPVQFPNKTAAQWNAISGAVGMQVCVNDSPVNAGKMAYWDTTNARWSYVDTNLAI